MQILTVAVAAALAGAASATEPAAAHPERKRTTTKHKSKHVKADEAYDPYLGLSNPRQLKKEDKEGHIDEMGSMPTSTAATATTTTTTTTVLDGSSYCTWGPDEDCYVTGWPACCRDDAVECPKDPPACEVTTTTSTAAATTTTAMSTPLEVGGDYCTWGFDYECYAMGKPACCFDDAVECPEEAPACDVTTTVAPPPEGPDGPTFVEIEDTPDSSSSLGVATAACAVAGAALLLSL